MPSNRLKLLWLAILLFPCLALAAQAIPYEPAKVTLTGKVASGKFQHPNGKWVAFSYLKLKEPVNVRQDPENPVNGPETGVTEIHLYSNEKAVRDSLKAKVGKEVAVEGTVFHGHTAWHVRPLVMDVAAVR